MREPAKVRISPKAMRTEWCISAKGGRTKPVTSSTHPKTHSVTDNINCVFFFIRSLFMSPTRVAREILLILLLTSFAIVLRNLLPPPPHFALSETRALNLNSCGRILSDLIVYLRCSSLLLATCLNVYLRCLFPSKS